MQNISLRSSGMRRKQNFELGLKVTQQSWLSLFSLLPSFFAFLASFFSLAGYLVGFILVGKVFRKAFRILGLDERKGRWVVEQDFHGNFQVSVTCFFCLFLWCPRLNCAHFGMVWKISSLCRSQQTKLSVANKTDDVTSGIKDVGRMD